MAKGNNYPKGGKNKGKVPDDGNRQGPKGKPASWVRTAGATGDGSMAAMESWNVAGAGVDEGEECVDVMPNEGNGPRQPLNGRIR